MYDQQEVSEPDDADVVKITKGDFRQTLSRVFLAGIQVARLSEFRKSIGQIKAEAEGKMWKKLETDFDNWLRRF